MALCVGTFFSSSVLFSLWQHVVMCPVGSCFCGVDAGALGKLSTCCLCKGVAISLMWSLIWNALCYSHNVTFHYRELGGRKFRLGVHRKSEERRKSVERRKRENSTLTVSLPITAYFNRPAEVISPCTIVPWLKKVFWSQLQSRFHLLDSCSYHFSALALDALVSQ